VVIENFFEGWTPEMIEAMKYTGSGCRTKDYWDNLPPKERKIRGGNFTKIMSKARIGCTVSEGTRRKLSKAQKELQESLTPEGRLKRNIKLSEGQARKTPEEKEEHSRNLSKAGKRYLANKTPEEIQEHCKRSFLSVEAMRKSSLSCRIKPSMPEIFAGLWIEGSHPGEWFYTGDRKHMDLLRSKGYMGLKVPDFFNINGWKAVMEILGGLGYWHEEEEEEEKVRYYKEQGFDCLVLFEVDCYDYGELEEKYKEFLSRGM
jgi:hypothetical protein